MNRFSFARSWILTGVLALLVSGGLAMVVTAAKVPVFEAWATRHLAFVRWSLVEHVNLANLIWFTALPAGLIQLTMSRSQPDVARTSIGMWLLAVGGIVAMLSCHPGLGALPVLSNYVPVLDHRLYLGGLAAYLIGVTWVHLGHVLSFGAPARMVDGGDPYSDLFDHARFGMWLGSAFFLAAMTTLFFAWRGTAPKTDLSPAVYFDILFWGGGHLLQHASSCFLLVVWILLMSWSGKPALTRSAVFPVFAWMGLPLLVLPYLLAQRPASDLYRHAFTELMRWGIAPPMALFLALAFHRRAKWWPHVPGFRRSALVFSILLLAVGVAFGMSIRGQDLRIPGHYHATIGAITIAFMTMEYVLLGVEREGARHRLIHAAIPLYGIGQLLFSGGLFVAGYFGLGRKTYGVEQDVTHPGQVAGLMSLSIGGILALAGGVLFALAWIGLLRRPSAKDGYHVR
mgnify:CR=1 FL=1